MASRTATDDKQSRLSAVLRSERGARDGANEIDRSLPARRVPGADLSARQDDTVVLRTVGDDESDDGGVAGDRVMWSRQLTTAFLRHANGGTHDQVTAPQRPVGPDDGAYADQPVTHNNGQVGTDASALSSTSLRPTAATTDRTLDRPVAGSNAAAAPARRPVPGPAAPARPAVPATAATARTAAGRSTTAARHDDPRSGQRKVYEELGRWIGVAQGALIFLAMLCLAQLIVLLFIERGLADAITGGGGGPQALLAHQKASTVMIPVLVAVALLVTGFAAWHATAVALADSATPPSRLADIPRSLWAVLFSAGLLLGVSLAASGSVLAVARQVNGLSALACGALLAVCLFAARSLGVRYNAHLADQMRRAADASTRPTTSDPRRALVSDGNRAGTEPSMG